MNKTALKNFATHARKELLKKVGAKACTYGVTDETIKNANIKSEDAIFINGKQLSTRERKQRDQLIARIQQIGFNQVMEEVAYTWFNRFTALRFMEVNDYLPTKVRILSSLHGDSAEPDMMKEALSLALDMDTQYVYDLKMANETEALFQYLIIKHCNELNQYMPFMFEMNDDYTELLFPDGLLATDSFIREMTNPEIIPEDHWKQVEIIGWLYQYYIAEEKDRVIKAKKRYQTEELPIATQLFTPEWIVRYMVQNSLGRYWVEAHPEQRDLLDNWEYYLDQRNPSTTDIDNKCSLVNQQVKVETMKCFDPAMGSGHILVYMFDILYEIYVKCGYMERDIPRLIIENNLFGLDIDRRAYQLAAFSLVMKALQYNRRFLRSIKRDGLVINIAVIEETNGISDAEIAVMAGETSGDAFDKMSAFIAQFHDAKKIGSVLKITPVDQPFIESRIEAINQQPAEDLFAFSLKDKAVQTLQQLLKQAQIMEQTYDVFITNPPYVGNRLLTPEASHYLKKHYPDSKSDLFAVFMEYSVNATKQNGHIGFMTPFVWMFLTSYEKLRQKLIRQQTITSLIQLEYSGFEEATVPICTFTLRNDGSALPGEYIRLADFKGAENQSLQTLAAVKNPAVPYRYTFNQEKFRHIPGTPIAYWVSKQVLDIFHDCEPLHVLADAKSGLSTADDKTYLRLWYEVDANKLSIAANNKKWLPYTKGGSYKKWFGNNEYVVNWENDGEALKNFNRAVIRNPGYYFREGATWGTVTSAKLSFRYTPTGFIYGNKGNGLFAKKGQLLPLLAILNSKVVTELLKIITPTISAEAGYIAKIPICDLAEAEEKVNQLAKENIAISKMDWDSFETSWNFRQHPFLTHRRDTVELADAYNNWKRFSETQFHHLKANEEELNRVFIEKYGLQGELTPDVDDDDVTLRKANLEWDVKSFISYAVGCMFGRYSLDEEGLIYAGGPFDPSRYTTFPADGDNIIPILPGAYFADDIVSRFVEFVATTFGAATLLDNIDFVSEAIGRRKNETARETLRRYFMTEFYKEHVRTYKKRPIYWLFTSGPKRAFNCLIYMHRYDQTTLSRMRTDYLHPYQTRLEVEKNDLLKVIEKNESAREVNGAKRALTMLDKNMEELKAFDEQLHHLADTQLVIDLDDGVSVNYEKFTGIVAKI